MTTKIEGPGRGTGVGRIRRTGRVADSAALEFERALNGVLGDGPEAPAKADAAPAGSGAAAVDALQGLLSIQDVGADSEASRRQRRDRLMRHGEDMLERLEDVRLGLLLGAIPKDRLMELARTVRARREQGPDRQLDALLDEIELRAEVELAKLSRAGA
ncbi:flagellar assembly protein FliX [Roseospira marina]|uniref:Flagellar assembly protein FliX n=1 Tax=Roseospira marina TaxID=140057 RepID=A0A5M6IC30_9PROT|nr:flagellar assembly protein FliX [Roseospira marina]KAA5605753.1 flagellar assembly protein FliX [Roseospira marina]MBB4313557.1 hypothetical protein [Roseospira marina]MBB5086719.1 hypothetical protein [Roseospira marina]